MLIEEVDRSVRERIVTTVFGGKVTIARALSREAKAWAFTDKRQEKATTSGLTEASRAGS
jgi:hypothetical protein